MIYSIGLTFYESAQWQSKNLDVVRWGSNLPFVAEVDYIPPFQLVIPTGASVTAEFNETSIDLTLTGLRTESKPDHDVLIYPGDQAIGSGLTTGTFFLKINDGTNDYFSEEFCFADVSDMIKVKYRHGDDYCISTRDTEYMFPYTSNHENFFYVKSDLVKPQYVYSTSVEDRAGTIMPLLHTVHKLHRFHFMGTEAILDTVMHIRLHDCITIDYKDRTYDVEDFLITPEFDEYAFYAGIDVEFKTSAISVVAGRGYDTNICVEEIQPTDICSIDPLYGPYASIQAATADGVVTGDYFDLTLTNDHAQLPVVYQMNPVGGYANVIAGEAALGKDVCFPLGDDNDHGYYLTDEITGDFAGMILIAPDTINTYDSDGTAQSAGIQLNGTYFLKNSNYGQETFIRVLRSCSITIVNVAVGTVNKFGFHNLTISVLYTGINSIVFETQGETRTVALDGSGTLTYTFTKLTPNGAEQLLKARNLTDDCNSMTSYTSPTSSIPPVAEATEWLVVEPYSEALGAITDCGIAVKVANMSIVFAGTSPTLPTIQIDDTVGTFKHEFTDSFGRHYQMTITIDVGNIQVDFWYPSGEPTFKILDDSDDSFLTIIPC